VLIAIEKKASNFHAIFLGSERTKLKNKVSEMLMFIEAKVLWHDDVRWGSMGCYKADGTLQTPTGISFRVA